MSGLPRQLPWRQFVPVLTRLGYVQLPNKSGASRTFKNTAGRRPLFVTFHEPHKGHPIARGTLREYVSKLELTPDEFMGILNEC